MQWMSSSVGTALDDFLGQAELAAAKRCMHSPVTVTAVIPVEDFR